MTRTINHSDSADIATIVLSLLTALRDERDQRRSARRKVFAIWKNLQCQKIREEHGECAHQDGKQTRNVNRQYRAVVRETLQ